MNPPMHSDTPLPRITSLLKVPASAFHAVYRVGSRVYGTAGPTSDEDFAAVLARPDQRQDLAFGDQINVVIHGISTFQRAVDDQSIFALECIFAPTAHVIKAPVPPFRYTLDRKKLAASATERSTSDWQKAKKRFAEEPEASKKKLFHALRVPIFALQLAKTGKLSDYTAANIYFSDIQRGPIDNFDFYEATFAAPRAALCAELSKLSAGK
jgi:hypothetical protein